MIRKFNDEILLEFKLIHVKQNIVTSAITCHDFHFNKSYTYLMNLMESSTNQDRRLLTFELLCLKIEGGIREEMPLGVIHGKPEIKVWYKVDC